MNLINLLQPLADAIPVASPRLGDPEGDALISLREAARILGCTERHVHRHLAQGRLTSTREGRNHRLKRGDVEALANKND